MRKFHRTGILTLEQRRLLKKKNLEANVKWNLFNPKSGRLTKKVKELSKDFEVIISSPHCWNWLASLPVTLSIIELKENLNKLSLDYFVPTKRLKAISKNGKRLFVVEPINVLRELPKSENKVLEKFVEYNENTTSRNERDYLKNLRREYNLSIIKSRSNLRQGEWRIIKRFYKKSKNSHLFFLPFEENKFYTWDEIKNKIIQDPTTLLKKSIE